MTRYILRTLTFLMIGGFIVVITDIIIMGDKGFLWRKNETISSGDPTLDVASLRTQHNNYMQRGIITQNTSNDAPPPPAFQTATNIPKDSLRLGPLQTAPIITDDKTNYALLDPPDVNITWERERDNNTPDRTFNSIEPATGTEGNDTQTTDTIPIEKSDTPKNEHVHLDYKEINAAIGTAKPPPTHAVEHHDVIEVIETPEPTRYHAPQGHGKIAVIIDDMGLGLRSKQVEIMHGPLTLSYLPYAKNLSKHVQRAKSHGHEIMLHIPMEPMNGSLDGGPRVLKTSMSKNNFDSTLSWGLSQFDGYVGVNNHMGSRLTADKKSMRRVMAKLKEKGVFFIDSKTIGSSVAADTAQEFSLPYAERDVFLDHDISRDFIEKALAKTERIARDKGYAIAIGHPHAQTIEALKKWIPTLKNKGLELVPASALVHRPSPNQALASHP